MDAGEELDVGAVEPARALADPEHVRGAVVPVARERVPAGEALLVVEQQPLMARPDVDLMQLRRRGEVDPARGHEGERPLDLGGEDVVALSLLRARDELLVPGVHLAEVGEAALREGTDEVQGRGGHVVALDHPLRVGPAGGGGRSVVVHHVAAEDRDLAVRGQLDRRRARLHELPGDPADLQHRKRGPVGEDGRHLQEDLQALADRDGREGRAALGEAGEVVERLGAVAGLEQERPAGRHLGRAPPAPAAPRRRRRAAARSAGARGRAASRSGSGHSGCWSASKSRHEDGDQVESTTATLQV